MDITIKEKSLIFIDESSLKIKDFLPVLEKIISDQHFSLVTFILDAKIKESLEKCYISTVGSEKYIFDGFLDVIFQTNKFDLIDTNNYFDYTQVEFYILKHKIKDAWFITQKEFVYFNMLELKNKITHINLCKIDKGQLVEWTAFKKKDLNAFYVDKDQYINRIKVEGLDYVYSPKYGYLWLLKDNALAGGEGTIYRTYNKKLCKIYHQEQLSYINQKKIDYMLTYDVYNPYVNWPKDILYYKNNFVGYLMDEIEDATALEDIRMDGFKGFSILDRYVMCYNLLNHINYLHQKHIVIGDLKLDNLLIKKPNEVYLIDCGSYQVGDYPCTVYHQEYTKKKYTEDELRKFLRAPEDEYYAINKIIFEILVGKKPNYDRNNIEIDGDRDIFEYPLDISKIDGSSARDLQLWKLMSDKMREMFYFYFKQGKVSYLPEWINEIKLVINSNKN